jgi:hypothetical protein
MSETTLDDLLALLPDNSSGQIGANDLRTIVTELWLRSSRFGQSFSFVWTGATSPAGGRVNMDAGWDAASVALWLSETTNDGQILDFVLFDQSSETEVWLTTQAGAIWHGYATTPSVDSGGFRTITVAAISVTGPVPAANDKVSVNVAVTMP